jgi:hypothetical protein
MVIVAVPVPRLGCEKLTVTPAVVDAVNEIGDSGGSPLTCSADTVTDVALPCRTETCEALVVISKAGTIVITRVDA